MLLAVYEEPLPDLPGRPDAPCAYVRFGDNPAYDEAEAGVRRQGRPVLRMPGGHFHMLVDPPAVAGALLQLAGELPAGR